MNSYLNIPRTHPDDDRLTHPQWTYASLTVIDGDRHLSPTHVAFDHLRFSEPPNLRGSQVRILLRNGEEEQQQLAEVLPHESAATRIPIRLLKNA